MGDGKDEGPNGASANDEPFVAHSLEVSLTVDDLTRSVGWYREVIGFTVDREHHRDGHLFAASMRAGSVRLLLGQDNGAKGVGRQKGEGFSFLLTTPQPIDALAERIVARGWTLDSPPADAFGVRMFRLRDPDGFRITFSSPRG